MLQAENSGRTAADRTSTAAEAAPGVAGGRSEGAGSADPVAGVEGPFVQAASGAPWGGVPGFAGGQAAGGGWAGGAEVVSGPAGGHLIRAGVGVPAAGGFRSGATDPRDQVVLEYLRGSRELVQAQRDVMLGYLSVLGSEASAVARPWSGAAPVEALGHSVPALGAGPVHRHAAAGSAPGFADPQGGVVGQGQSPLGLYGVIVANGQGSAGGPEAAGGGGPSGGPEVAGGGGPSGGTAEAWATVHGEVPAGVEHGPGGPGTWPPTRTDLDERHLAQAAGFPAGAHPEAWPQAAGGAAPGGVPLGSAASGAGLREGANVGAWPPASAGAAPDGAVQAGPAPGAFAQGAPAPGGAVPGSAAP
ncbi:hypothetical protein ACWGDE_39060, partial [Streptomyces sp. NPDC054956]